MKIGILSLVLSTNYGGIIQAYALQTVLEQMGHQVVVVNKDRDQHISTFRYFLVYLKYLFNRYLRRKDIKFVNSNQLNRKRIERERFTQQFIDNYIHARVVKGINNQTFEDVDCIIVGSDQVWRPIYFQKLWGADIADAFLRFVNNPNIRKYAYAASFGTDKWEFTTSDTTTCAKLIKDFDAVSVREKSALLLCKEHLKRDNATLVLDPSFLLDKEDYIHLVKKKKTPHSPGDLMCYVLDETKEKKALINRISKERGYTPFYTNSQAELAEAPQEKRIQPPLEQWLRGFMDAKFVITDSYHACVFSIIFNKPFIVIGNHERGLSRFSSLLESLSLYQNLILSVDEYDSLSSYEIPEESYIRYEKLKAQSFAFLKKI